MESLRKLGQQLLQAWQGMSPTRRLLLMLGLVVCAAVAGGSYWLAQPDYSVLFSGLSPEDAGAITSKLQAQSTPYRLGDGGTTILVPADQVQKRRIEMAVEGLPVKGGKGFELFDQSSLGMTPFTEHVNYLRALQAELARTIMQIDPVTSARVHVVRPDPSPFIREQKPTTASVMLRLRPGATLGRNIAAGIVALVSRSVEGLAPENVTLVDANGHLLSDPHASESGSINSQMDYRREVETYLAGKAESMLGQLLGPGRAIVRVTADINFQRVHEKKETYNPEGRVVTSEKIMSSKAGTPQTAARGVAGTASNLGKGPATPAAAATNSAEETIQTDYAISKVTQELEDKVGNVERLTIAALVDLSAPGAGKDAGPPMTLADVQDIIKQAVGFKDNRDAIKVSSVHLPAQGAPPPPEEEVDRLHYWQNLLGMVRNAALGLAALVGLVLAWMVVRRVRPAAVPRPAESPAAGEAAAPLPQALQQNPEAIARVLAAWLGAPERQQRTAA
jgi:flagellar M-ring protein FliF